MNNEEHGPIFGQSYGGTSLLSLIACVFEPDKWIKKHLASFFKSYAMFVKIAGRLFRVPNKTLTTVKEEEVHRPNVYTLYGRRSTQVKIIAPDTSRDASSTRQPDHLLGWDQRIGPWQG